MIAGLQIHGGARIDGQPARKPVIASQSCIIHNHSSRFESTASALTRRATGWLREVVTLSVDDSAVNLLVAGGDHTVG